VPTISRQGSALSAAVNTRHLLRSALISLPLSAHFNSLAVLVAFSWPCWSLFRYQINFLLNRPILSVIPRAEEDGRRVFGANESAKPPALPNCLPGRRRALRWPHAAQAPKINLLGLFPPTGSNPTQRRLSPPEAFGLAMIHMPHLHYIRPPTTRHSGRPAGQPLTQARKTNLLVQLATTIIRNNKASL